MLSARMSPSRTTSPRAFTNRHSITLSMRLSTSFRVPPSRMGALLSTFAMRSSSLAFAEQMRAVRLSTCALHMASSWGLLGSRRSLSIVYLLIFVSEAPDAAGVFHACPSKAQRKTSAGALFGQGREMGSAQPSERPSQGLCSDRGAKRSQNSPPEDLEKPFKGRCAVAGPVSRYSGASGQKTRGAPVVWVLPLLGKRTPARDLREGDFPWVCP